jgi:hypothetical protein
MHMIYLSDRNTYSLRNVSSKNGKKLLPIVEQELFTILKKILPWYKQLITSFVLTHVCILEPNS